MDHLPISCRQLGLNKWVANMNKYIPANIHRHIDDSFEMVLDGSSIIAVYVFGSILTGHSKKESDIDIATLLDEKFYKADPLASIAPVYLAATRAGMALDRKTDVTILNSASLEIAYEILTSGFCILETNSEKRLEYEIAVRGMYFDFKPFLDKIRTDCIKAL